MKFLKVLLWIIVILAIIIVGGGLFLPKSYSVTRSTVINAPDSVVYKNIADFNEFYKWNPWAKMEPTAKSKVSGPVAQPGHLYEWEGKETGQGYMKIITAKPNTQVDIELKFIKPFESLADTKFDIQPEGSGQKVSWTMSGDNNLMGKWMCVFMSMDKMIGKDFEDGLKFLKEKSEKGN
ncbi:SRPBCC family protein [Pedobacter punctiformis]|uniref:SRPBCC family protein n=1 Tax=Pedobacter punctiformis TaxID=3004097 RepID=A0ABT4L9E8_9SPHI|nr:SRPBCC family protein [Pedobacter sp. HCMS5-2]MCZ4244536.1 SRPBCC family protein [Pedobacter sp. HCMS5-2]